MKKSIQIFILPLILYSCSISNKTSEVDNSLEVNKVHCQDTSLVWIHPFNDNKDTIFRLSGVEVSGYEELEDGYWIIYYDKEFTKKTYEFKLKNNKKEGKYTYWQRNGNKWFEGYMKNGMDHGEYQSWYKSGQLKNYWKSRNDTIIGTTKSWTESGELQKEIEYFNGRRMKSTQYHKNGQKSTETYFKNYNNSYQNIEYIELRFDTLANFEKAYSFRLDTIVDKENYEETIMLSKIEIDYIGKRNDKK